MNSVGGIIRYPSSKVIRNENVVFFDVDGTLINHGQVPDRIGKHVSVYDAVTDTYLPMQAHEPNIRLLLEEKHKGSYVIVWSRGGHEWAENVLKALNLFDKVNLIMTKPLVYIDDLPIEKWLPYRVFLEPDTIYKTNQTKEK